MGTMTGKCFISEVLRDGNETPPLSMRGAPLPCTIVISPEAGDTVLVEYTKNNGNDWKPLPCGGVTVYTEQVVTASLTHIRGQRTNGSGTTSTVEVV